MFLNFRSYSIDPLDVIDDIWSWASKNVDYHSLKAEIVLQYYLCCFCHVFGWFKDLQSFGRQWLLFYAVQLHQIQRILCHFTHILLMFILVVADLYMYIILHIYIYDIYIYIDRERENPLIVPMKSSVLLCTEILLFVNILS